MSQTILLGYEWGTGSEVTMKLTHTVVAGMTQFGKTTTLEAIIARSRLKAIAFKTKRGEAGFHNYREIPPYFRAGSGWQYVESLVNVALGEKVKYEPGMRGAIMSVSRGGFKDLRELLVRAERLTEEARREFQRDLYMKLSEYLKLVVPELEKHVFSDKIELDESVNVMDLSDMRIETQSLVISSVLSYAAQSMDHIIIIIPEAWEHIPQGRMTPVKLVAAQFIRKGAAIGNYLFLDSQDIAGIDKEPLRQCDNWILGRQKDKREVDRTLEEIFVNRPSVEDIMTLPRGVFYACLGDKVFKVYVQPSWLHSETAKAIAMGSIRVEDVNKPEENEDEMVWKEKYLTAEKENKKLKEANQELEKMVDDAHVLEVPKLREENKRLQEENRTIKTDFSKQVDDYLEALKKKSDELEETRKQVLEVGEESKKVRVFVEALRELLAPPKELLEAALKASSPLLSMGNTQLNLTGEILTVQLTPQERVVEVDASKGWAGKILQVLLTDLKNAEKISTSDVSKMLQDHGWFRAERSVRGDMLSLIRDGLVVKDENGYRLPRKVCFKEVD